MSHGHTHAPGEEHSHSHGPPQPQQQAQIIPPLTDPALQALIDADFQPVDIKIDESSNAAFCKKHSLEKCSDCDVDFVGLNRLSRLLAANPNLRCPPPSNVVSQQLTQAITNTRNEGNNLFKAGQHVQALTRYTMAASIAVQRPPWESNQFMREELSTSLSNRAASYLEMKDYISALADAEGVIQLKRNWSKAHFRKAKSLVGLGRPEEAADALQLGLSYEPGNAELQSYLSEIQNRLETK